MLKKIHYYFLTKLRFIKNELSWNIDLEKIKKLKPNTVTVRTNNINEYNKILVVVPHADDELIGCYNFIKKNNKKIKLFYCGYLGTKTNYLNKNIRLKEFIGVCDYLNVDFSISQGNLKDELYKEILDYSPDLILLPYYLDWHEEHREVNYLIYAIIKKYNKRLIQKIGCYKISTPIPASQVNFIVSLAKKDLNEKKKVFYKYYRSQKYLPLNRFFYEDRAYGRLFKLYAAEIYSIFDIDTWKKKIELIRKENILKEISRLKKIVNQIFDKWKLVDEIERRLQEEYK